MQTKQWIGCCIIPGRPVNPVNPIGPVLPVLPLGPTGPSLPGTPVIPVKPIGPETPEGHKIRTPIGQAAHQSPNLYLIFLKNRINKN